jgi:hypothetical protein
MVHKIHLNAQWTLPVIIGMCLLSSLLYIKPASALTPLPNPEPKPGSFGLEATKTKTPPTQGATITTPGNGGSFSTSPITVSGICPNGLLVQVYNNGVMVGAVMCTAGSFSLQVSLFAGINELTAVVFDEIDQAGPPSNIVTVTYTDTSFTSFGALITLTSSYGRRSAAATTQLSWPLQLSGGAGPYAFSIDWGDGSPAELKSQSLSGVVTIDHVFKKAGIYQVNVKVTDVNGVSAFLQVIAVSNGKIDSSTSPEKIPDTTPPPQILWIPTAVALILLIPSFWLGRLSQITTIRNKMLKERDSYNKEK